jgi:ABC-type sugar transport system ATPase subunit
MNKEADNQNILEMDKVTKKFFTVTALDKVSISLKKGEVLALVGENGAGKSTLMKVLSGSYPSGSYEGTISVENKKVRFHTSRDAEKVGIEMIYQEISPHKDLSIAENIFLGNWPRMGKTGFLDKKTMITLAKEAVGYVGLDVNVNERMGWLSTSQQQLVSIAKALYRKPKILVLDEPTSALTQNETDRLLEIIQRIKDRGISCIYISHKLDEVFTIADRITVLRDGKTISTFNKNEVEPGKIVEDMVGRKIENMFPKVTVPIGDVLLDVRNFTVPSAVPGMNLLEDVSFSVRAGEILGLGGLVGAGRSELVNAVFGYGKKESGTIRIYGEEISDLSPENSIKNRVGLLTEDRKATGFVGSMNIEKNITLARLDKIKSRLFISTKKERNLASEFYNKLNIKAPGLDTNILTLSGGNQQKAVLAKWLMADSRVLILDEPTRGIDVGAKVEIYKIMEELAREGVAIIMVSSELPELLAMCDRFVVLYKGKVRGEFNRDEISEEVYMKAATGLTDIAG